VDAFDVLTLAVLDLDFLRCRGLAIVERVVAREEGMGCTL
jgi:hypothetical protein